MASPVLDATIRIKNYVPHGDGPGGSAKEIVFPLKIERIQKEINDGSQVIVLPFYKSEPFSFGQITYIMSLDGAISENGIHVPHPTTDAVDHFPDFIDLEEAILLWQKESTARGIRTLSDEVPQIELHYGGIDGVTNSSVYKFLFLKAEIAKIGGQFEIPFKLQLGILWDLSLPGLREWS